MNLWFRLAWLYLTWRFAPRLNLWDVGRRSFRVWPTDLDIFNHMNNGVYLTLLDLGRTDLMLRCGAWQHFRRNKWYPVVVAETITFRKSLKPWQKFDIETAVIGWDDQSGYIEQRFVVKGEIYAQAIMRARYLVNPRGVLTPEQVFGGTGAWQGEQPILPDWVVRWAQESKLPRTREAAPSVWPREQL